MARLRYPESQATETWTKDDIEYSIVRTSLGHYCGYCRFPKGPLIEQGYDGIASYVPVHGGLTYAREDADGTMVYGFDCAHLDDANNPKYQEPSWLKAECERMAKALRAAVECERSYLATATNEQRAEVLDKYHAVLREREIFFKLSDNFGAMIHVICGQL